MRSDSGLRRNDGWEGRNGGKGRDDGKGWNDGKGPRMAVSRRHLRRRAYQGMISAPLVWRLRPWWVAAGSDDDRPLLTGAIFVAIICAAGGAHASY